MVVFALGVPLTVVDGAVTLPLRVPRGTTADEAVSLAGVSLRPLDRLALASRGDGTVASGDTIRVIRVSDTQAVAEEPIAFAVKTVSDATLPLGRTAVATPGVPGIAQNTYSVLTADGVEESRTLLVSVELRAPVTEVRRVGTLVPAPAGDIQGIIRTAAARWGADESQLLRVAYCESRYNPNAFNASSGASGLFQFLATTWAANSVRAGYAGASVFDPVANANTAAYMFANGQARQWQCK
jgi:soluble lytic murein transglycosylase-like protein